MQGFEDNADAVAGAEIFAQVGCANCHTYLGVGLLEPRRSRPLRRRRERPRRRSSSPSYVANPAQFGNNVMPPFAGLGEENLAKLGAFLDASKGPKELVP